MHSYTGCRIILNGMEQTSADRRMERFKRVAQSRTQKALRAIELLQRCSRRTSYSYTEDDAEKIVSAIEKKVAKLRASFVGESEEEFRL